MELKESDDKCLVKKIKAGESSNECLKELYDRHAGIYYHVVRKLALPRVQGGTTSIDTDYMMGNCLGMIYEAALDFDPGENTKFSSYLGSRTKWKILGEIRKLKNMPYETLSDELASVSPKRMERKDMLDKFFLEIRGLKDKRIARIFELRYLEGEGNNLTTWLKISPHIPSLRDPSTHVTWQRCAQLHDKALKDIREKMRSEIE